MSTQSDDNSPQQSLPVRPIEQSSFDWGNPLSTAAAATGASNDLARLEEVKRHVIDSPSIDSSRPEKIERTTTIKERSQPQVIAQEQTQAQLKPARSKRSKSPSGHEASDQAEIVTKPKRKSTRKTAKVAEAPNHVASVAADIPPITPAAIEFLGKQKATAADVLKLGPDSMAFIQYHFKNMQQLEVESALTNAYLRANVRPISPAFQKLFDELVKHGRRRAVSASTKDLADVPARDVRQPANAPKATYRQRTTQSRAYASVVVQFRWMNIASSAIGQQAKILVPLFANADKTNENSVERSLIHLVAARQHGSFSQQVVEVQEPSAAWMFAGEQVASTAPNEKAKINPVRRANSGWRLLDPLAAGAYRASKWFLEQGRQDSPPEGDTWMSMNKSAPAPAWATPANDKSAFVPESVTRRFLKVEREYYFQDRTPAFSDRGNKLATKVADPDVVRSLVEIAKAREWMAITVRGTEEFRRIAWLQAIPNGLTVIGYKPTALDLAELSTRSPYNTVEKGAVQEKGTKAKRDTAEQPVAPANFPQQTTVARHKVEKAVSEAQQQGLDPAAKAKAFHEQTPAFVVKKFPDLAAAYGVVAAAEAFANDKLPEKAREDFVRIAHRHLLEKIMAGKQIQGPKIYSTATRSSGPVDRTNSAGVILDLGKSERTTSLEREN